MWAKRVRVFHFESDGRSSLRSFYAQQSHGCSIIMTYGSLLFDLIFICLLCACFGFSKIHIVTMDNVSGVILHQVSGDSW